MLVFVHDRNPKHRIPFQFVTVALIGACVAVFHWQSSLPPREEQEAVYALGAIPAVIFGHKTLPPELAWVPAELTLITSMFMHGGWMHLIGNMLYLWILGDNVEDAMGHVKFIIFYILSGLAAVFAHMAVDTTSQVPLVGASGAISGVIGAYLLLYPTEKLYVPAGHFVSVPVPAWIVLGSWTGLQLFNAAQDSGTVGGVAWWAHIGGAVAGMILVPFFKHRDVPLLEGTKFAKGRHRPLHEPKKSRSGRVNRPWH